MERWVAMLAALGNDDDICGAGVSARTGRAMAKAASTMAVPKPAAMRMALWGDATMEAGMGDLSLHEPSLTVVPLKTVGVPLVQPLTDENSIQPIS